MDWLVLALALALASSPCSQALRLPVFTAGKTVAVSKDCTQEAGFKRLRFQRLWAFYLLPKTSLKPLISLVHLWTTIFRTTVGHMPPCGAPGNMSGLVPQLLFNDLQIQFMVKYVVNCIFQMQESEFHIVMIIIPVVKSTEIHLLKYKFVALWLYLNILILCLYSHIRRWADKIWCRLLLEIKQPNM